MNLIKPLAAIGLLCPLLLATEPKTATIAELLAKLQALRAATDFRAAGRVVRVTGTGVRKAYQVSIKGKWFSDGLKIFYEVHDPSPSRVRVLLETNPAGKATIRTGHAGDHSPREILPESWGEALLDSDLSYEDMTESQFLWRNQTLVKEEKYGARNCYVIRSEPGASDQSHYSSVTSWLDQDILFPVKVEKLIKSSGSVKEFIYYGLRESSGVWSANQVEVRIKGRPDSTLLIFTGVQRRHILAPAIFFPLCSSSLNSPWSNNAERGQDARSECSEGWRSAGGSTALSVPEIGRVLECCPVCGRSGPGLHSTARSRPQNHPEVEPLIIRPARPADNDALCRMERLAPQGSKIRLAEERHDFFCRAQQFPGAIILVAANEAEGSLAGVMGGAPLRVRIAGKERRAAFIFDFRSNPEYQRGLHRAIFSLWQEVERGLRDAGAEFVFGLVKEDNPTNSIYYRVGAQEKGERVFWTLPVYRKKRVPPGVEIHDSTDAAEDYRSAADWYRNYDLWPLLSSSELHPSIYNRCLRAEVSYQGASLKIWDNTRDFQRIVVSAPWTYNWMRPIAKAVAGIVPVPRIPRIGSRLRTWQLYDLRLPAGEPSCRSLLAAANNLALAEGIDFLVVSASSGEKELAAAGRGSLATMRYRILAKAYAPLPNFSDRIYFDIRFS